MYLYQGGGQTPGGHQRPHSMYSSAFSGELRRGNPDSAYDYIDTGSQVITLSN